MPDNDKLRVHYHIFINHGAGIKEEPAFSYDDLLDKLPKAIQLVKDLTGCNIKEQTEYKTTFTSGAFVRWQPCYSFLCTMGEL